MASSFICVVSEWKQRSASSRGLIFQVRGGSLRTSTVSPFSLGGKWRAKNGRCSSSLGWYTWVCSMSKERSSVEVNTTRDWQVTVDHDSPSQQTIISWNGKDRFQLVPELVLLCDERSLNIEHLVVRSENERVSCNLELSKNGTKLSSEETQRLQRDLQELNKEQSEDRQRSAMQSKSTNNPELPYIDYRDRFVDYEKGVAFYTDNHATPTHTTLTAIVPNTPSFLSYFMKQLSQMPVHIIFASLSTYNREGKTRHDVYHIINENGEQLDAAQCDALVDVVSALFQGENNSQDGL
ncbi:uncharacterized protein Gasu_24330 [Galdieria sulphuraria]|uniref:ACT domain-containing protein n=1 Tax=Galdieria sulphuraria TaxID=130081 RepID=M2X1R3_GALSU|nr:uncharacterized protein Gasu_24330 [Galdieria sulphuraria]EME30285.1 hypothetical protein Gasu_24330 [Galdieria sulphuraria]|eukprot:XP_005706805.1 hypothetical protein Gasu_24330 [Galdieria sulphuraria]